MLSNNLQLKLFDRITAVPALWDDIANSGSIFMQRTYLNAVEKNADSGLYFRYALLFMENKLVAIASFQIMDFNSKIPSEGSSQLCIIKRMVEKIKQLSEKLAEKIIVNGNAFATGEHGFLFIDDLPKKQAYLALAETLAYIRKNDVLHDHISGVLTKDFCPKSQPYADQFINYDYHAFASEPNMVINIDSDWTSFDDYLACMVSKYRTKAKSSYKKAKSITTIDFDTVQIQQYIAQIKQLYDNVESKAEFSLGNFNIETFVDFKNDLKSEFFFKGYFLEEKLVGFSTGFLYGSTLDAHYVGLDYEYNYDHAIYPCMLYDYVKMGIDKGMSIISLGRTAEEIKSSIGAVPVNMKLYFKHKNTISNHLITPIVKHYKPSPWKEIDPFKKEYKQNLMLC